MKETVYKLVKVLEQLEDDLVFTVFYSFAEFLESKYYFPAWDFEGRYYEIQYDNSNDLQVLRWPVGSGNMMEGYVLSKDEIDELCKNLAEMWANKELKEDMRFKSENDKSLIYDSTNNRDICMYYGDKNKQLLLKLLNNHYEEI